MKNLSFIVLFFILSINIAYSQQTQIYQYQGWDFTTYGEVIRKIMEMAPQGWEVVSVTAPTNSNFYLFLKKSLAHDQIMQSIQLQVDTLLSNLRLNIFNSLVNVPADFQSSYNRILEDKLKAQQELLLLEIDKIIESKLKNP